jgi:hypothetical protein
MLTLAEHRPKPDDLVMLTLRKILVPIDFNETSDKALDFAIELARKFDAEVIVMHAYAIPFLGFPDGVLVVTADVAIRIQEAAKKGLDAAVSVRASHGARLSSILRDGVGGDPRCVRREQRGPHRDGDARTSRDCARSARERRGERDSYGDDAGADDSRPAGLTLSRIAIMPGAGRQEARAHAALFTARAIRFTRP